MSVNLSKTKNIIDHEESIQCNGWSPFDTLILVDWDDTILPSSSLNSLSLVSIFSDTVLEDIKTYYPVLHDNLATLDQVACKFFNLLLTKGRVIIVTNAEEGWVQVSASQFLPNTYRFLLRNCVPFVSARTKYQSPSEPSPMRWKQLCFENVVSIVAMQRAAADQKIKTAMDSPDTPSTAEFDESQGKKPNSRNWLKFSKRTRFTQPRLNLVSIGDSEAEREALLKLSSVNHMYIAKTVKLIELPNSAQLIGQLTKLIELLPPVIESHESKDLCFCYNNLA